MDDDSSSPLWRMSSKRRDGFVLILIFERQMWGFYRPK
ncbi:hypothetical protein SLEP1_g21013 [Rubroshorea leprosula]|uniref:Uncharacterized protein n=1 Tax=Rubroshorea leprosula TaxID=152421 RepID=A0AAV5JAN0_9ROSI|nr:hypothetical protein SLEP1_g21013 [Rubroshorea leprosula]